MLLGLRRGVDGAIMAVRPELLQADAVQQSALNTITPPCAIRCVCVHMQQYVQPSQTARLPPQHVPQLLLGGQELSEVQKPQKLTIQFLNVGQSVHVTTVRQYLTSGVLYSKRSQLGGKERA